MDQSTKDETRGKIHEAKGAIKEKVGQVINKYIKEQRRQE